MRVHWFTKEKEGPWRQLLRFRPATWQGQLLLLWYFAYLVFTFWNIDRFSHSVSDTLGGFAPRFIIATALLYLIMSSTQRKI